MAFLHQLGHFLFVRISENLSIMKITHAENNSDVVWGMIYPVGKVNILE